MQAHLDLRTGAEALRLPRVDSLSGCPLLSWASFPPTHCDPSTWQHPKQSSPEYQVFPGLPFQLAQPSTVP